MEQNRTKLTVLNLVVLLIAGVAGLAVARASHALTAQVAVCSPGSDSRHAGQLFPDAAGERERLERLEYDD